MGNKLITDKYYDETKMRTRQKRVVTDTCFMLYAHNKDADQPLHPYAQSDQRLCCSLPR